MLFSGVVVLAPASKYRPRRLTQACVAIWQTATALNPSLGGHMADRPNHDYTSLYISIIPKPS